MVYRRLFLFQLVTFLLIITAFCSTSYAIVVAPLITIGIVKLTVFLIGVISVPVTYVVKFFTKNGWVKVIAYSLVSLAVLGVIVFGILKVLADRSVFSSNRRVNMDSITKLAPVTQQEALPRGLIQEPAKPIDSAYLPPEAPSAGAPPPRSFGIDAFFIKVLGITILVLAFPIALTLIAIDYTSKRWKFGQILLVSLSIAFVISIILAVVLTLVTKNFYF